MYDYETIKRNFEGNTKMLSHKEMCAKMGEKYNSNPAQIERQRERWKQIISWKYNKSKKSYYAIKLFSEEELNFDFDYFAKINSCLQEIKQCKNYPELCTALKESVLGGSSRDAQIDKWRIYFSWKRSGNKYTRIRLLSLEQVLNNLI